MSNREVSNNRRLIEFVVDCWRYVRFYFEADRAKALLEEKLFTDIDGFYSMVQENLDSCMCETKVYDFLVKGEKKKALANLQYTQGLLCKLKNG